MSGCPKCGVSRRAPLWLRLCAVPFMLVGLALAIPTVGLSLVITIYGLFLWKPDCKCGGHPASSPADVAKAPPSDIL